MAEAALTYAAAFIFHGGVSCARQSSENGSEFN